MSSTWITIETMFNTRKNRPKNSVFASSPGIAASTAWLSCQSTSVLTRMVSIRMAEMVRRWGESSRSRTASLLTLPTNRASPVSPLPMSGSSAITRSEQAPSIPAAASSRLLVPR